MPIEVLCPVFFVVVVVIFKGPPPTQWSWRSCFYVIWILTPFQIYGFPTFSPFHSVVSFSRSILNQGTGAQSCKVAGPGHTAGEMQDQDLNLAIPEPGCFTSMPSCLTQTLPLLVFVVPHQAFSPHHQPRTHSTLWALGGTWAVVMFCRVQQCIPGVEKVCPDLRGKKVRRGGPTLATPVSPSPRGLLIGLPRERCAVPLGTDPPVCLSVQASRVRISSPRVPAVGPWAGPCLWEPRFPSAANLVPPRSLPGSCEPTWEAVSFGCQAAVLRTGERVCLLLALPGRTGLCASPGKPQLRVPWRVGTAKPGPLGFAGPVTRSREDPGGG